jgi:hypothetical protein
MLHHKCQCGVGGLSSVTPEQKDRLLSPLLLIEFPAGKHVGNEYL